MVSVGTVANHLKISTQSIKINQMDYSSQHKSFMALSIYLSQYTHTHGLQNLKLSQRMNAIKFPQAISCINFRLKTNVSQTSPVSVIRVNVRSDQN